MSAGSAPKAIELFDVGVHYRVQQERIVSLKEYIVHRIHREIEYRDLWALQSVDLEVRPGEIFGVVGRNGAGKSTLLKVISRVLPPTTGRVIVRGRVAPLLELGAGFHPDMTGRENVVLNSTILGHSRALIQQEFAKVVEFAELAQFINAPIRTYSSGMQARLGFAVATMVRPDILIIDEVLAVGDIGFQEKCLERIASFQEEGTSVVLVSHSPETIERYCHRAAWIEQGKVAALGEPGEVLAQYREFVAAA